MYAAEVAELRIFDTEFTKLPLSVIVKDPKKQPTFRVNGPNQAELPPKAETLTKKV